MPVSQATKDAQKRYHNKKKEKEEYQLKVSLRNRQNYLRRKEKTQSHKQTNNSNNISNEIIVNKIDSNEIIEPVIEPENKPEIKEEIKEDITPEIKPEIKEEIKEPLKEDITPEIKEEIKPEIKEEIKEPIKEDITPEIKPEITEQMKNNLVNEIINKEDTIKRKINVGYTHNELLEDKDFKQIIIEDIENEKYNIEDLTPEERKAVNDIIQEIKAEKLNNEVIKITDNKRRKQMYEDIYRPIGEENPIKPINKPYKLSNNNKDLEKFKHKRTLRKIIKTLKPKSLKNIQRVLFY